MLKIFLTLAQIALPREFREQPVDSVKKYYAEEIASKTIEHGIKKFDLYDGSEGSYRVCWIMPLYKEEKKSLEARVCKAQFFSPRKHEIWALLFLINDGSSITSIYDFNIRGIGASCNFQRDSQSMFFTENCNELYNEILKKVYNYLKKE
ncbi:MAG: hypothetical protein KatS3mg001_563 [Candidatus Pacearchaeota archaeon]|nr:MAG: hypothetical protein KatS3mg001_563 [Candidatus Pacearchaeota archaeon]